MTQFGVCAVAPSRRWAVEISLPTKVITSAWLPSTGCWGAVELPTMSPKRYLSFGDVTHGHLKLPKLSYNVLRWLISLLWLAQTSAHREGSGVSAAVINPWLVCGCCNLQPLRKGALHFPGPSPPEAPVAAPVTLICLRLLGADGNAFWKPPSLPCH